MRVSGKHNDLDNVGPSLRHHTFFEMLGNFSFGDYFKQDAIEFAWKLLTEEWKLPPDRLLRHDLQGRRRHPARRRGATSIWREFLPADRIGELGAGRQLLADGRHRPVRPLLGDLLLPRRRAALRRGSRRRLPRLECGCDRFVEIWNNVFMEFDRQADGTLNPLPAPSIDTGMGLERITAVIQGTLSNYDTDLFTPLLARDRRARRHDLPRDDGRRRTSRCAWSPITCAR